MPIYYFFYLFLFFVSCTTHMAQTHSNKGSLKKIPISEHTTLIIPGNFQPEKAESRLISVNDFELHLYARKFVPGDIIYMEIIPKNKITIENIYVDKKIVRISNHDWGLRGFFAVHPEDQKNEISLIINYENKRNQLIETFSIPIEKKVFPVSRSTLDVGKYSRTDILSQADVQERIEKEIREKEIIYGMLENNHIGHILAHPRDFHQLNSLFYAKRIYEQFVIKNGQKIFQKPRISFHRGLDFRARTGDKVFAMANGKIVLAKELFYEGNCVIIDHGNKILTVYMHLSKLNVYPGQLVKAGHLLGLAGSTGSSTGAHLHVSMSIDSVPVDPLSLIYLPVRF